MTLGEIIKKYREENNLSMGEFSKRSGISKSYISLLEKNKHPKTGKPIAPSIQRIKQAAIGMNMDFDTLFSTLDGEVDLSKPSTPGNDLPSNVKPVDPSSRTVKIYGRIAGGKPIEMIENVIDEVDLSTLPEKYDGHYFGLQIRGHSMEPDIKDGDYIICVEAEDAESGDIVAVTVNGEDATCKRILKYKDGIRLVPLNPSYEVKYYTNKEVLSLPVRVIGRVLEARHRFHD